MIFKSTLLTLGLAVTGLAATLTPRATTSHVATYDTDFSTNTLGIGPNLPSSYLDLLTKGWGVVSRAKNVAAGGLIPNTPYNFILTNRLLAPQGASFAAAKPYTKVTFKSFYFGFVVQDLNGAADVTASDTLTVQGLDSKGKAIPGAIARKGFTGAGASTNPINMVQFTFPTGFPAVYNLTFSYTQPVLNALLIDTLSYSESS